MDTSRKERLIKKYQSVQSPTQKKTMNISGRGNRDAALSATGKPKHTKETIIRLFQYLSHEIKNNEIDPLILIPIFILILNIMINYFKDYSML